MQLKCCICLLCMCYAEYYTMNENVKAMIDMAVLYNLYFDSLYKYLIHFNISYFTEFDSDIQLLRGAEYCKRHQQPRLPLGKMIAVKSY